jgi:hypothetical protein
VILKEEIKGDQAEELVKKCPVHVFDIEDLGPGEWAFSFSVSKEEWGCRFRRRKPVPR